MSRLRLASYWAAACGGCDVAVLDLHERILEVVELAEIVFWPIAMDFKYSDVEAMPEGHIDVCLFSGAIRSAENEHLAKLLRAKSKLLVALGSCAHLGGIPGLANLATRRDLLRHVFKDALSTINPDCTVPLAHTHTALGELLLPELQPSVRALHQVVAVDYFLPGCPPPPDRLWEVIQVLASGQLPPRGSVVGATDVALCEECPRTKSEKQIKEFRSIAAFVPDPEVCLLEQGVICCGPATRGGCGASCLSANMPCRGCTGPLPGMIDQGGKLLSAVASVIEASEPGEIERVVSTIQDPAGTFYRFGLPTALLEGAINRDTV